MMFGASNPSLPRIVANVKSIPSHVEPMVLEWTAAKRDLPVGVRWADLTGLDAARVAAILAGTAAASRSECLALDNALGTFAWKFLPATSTASMPQRIEPFKIAPKPTKSRAKLNRSAPKPLSDAHAARVESWRVRHERSGLLMTAIATKTKIQYARIKELLRRGAIPTPYELRALEKLLGKR